MKNITNFLAQLGYNKKEAKIYIELYRMGSSPASSISRQAKYERIYTYKALQKMVNDGIISQTKKSGTTHFWIPDTGLLLLFIQQKSQHRKKLQEQFDSIQIQFKLLESHQKIYTPKIHLYEGIRQTQNMFSDMKTEITQQQLLSISVFGTHTFQEQIVSSHSISHYATPFISHIRNKNIAVSNYIAEGGLIMEQLRLYPGIEKFGELPAGDNAINIFLIGKIVYIAIYKGQPVGLKIESPELARALNFVLRQTERK